MARDYKKYTVDELIAHINELEKQLKSNKYGLYWDMSMDKEKVVEECIKNIPILSRLPELDIVNGMDDNILIEGDNYHSLLALKMAFGNGLADIIYIDPPYNTGNEDFIYNDNLVNSDDGFKHSKWLEFMKNRLLLAKDLLKNRGVFFISIDDNEVFQLKLLCDDIIGSNNFMVCMPRITKKSGKSTNSFSKNHDYVLIYVKNDENVFLQEEHVDPGFKFEDEFVEKRGNYKLNQTLDYNTLGYVNSLDFPIIFEGETYYPGNVTKEEYEERKRTNPKDGFRWRWSEKLVEFGIKNGFVEANKKTHRLYTKTYLKCTISKRKDDYYIEYTTRTKPLSSIDLVQNEYSNDNARKELDGFKIADKFDYPKPSSLIKRLVKTYFNPDAIVLDFFAGSGTTAQAVLELNQEDGGNRKFILCTNNEGNICQNITYKRIKTLITGIKEDGTQYSNGINTNLRYLRTAFIEDSNNSDQAKYDLVACIDPLLCIKEETYELISKNNFYSHYCNNMDKHTFIYFDFLNDHYFDKFAKEINDCVGEISIYIFSINDELDQTLVSKIKQGNIKAIPAKLYEIFKENAENIKRGY